MPGKRRSGKVADPYYASAEWKVLRAAALKRDRYRCTVTGCGETRRLSVDHRIERRHGGPDTLENLRTLCGPHHNQSHREKGSGGAARVEDMYVRGCDVDGRPKDPNHPWHRPR